MAESPSQAPAPAPTPTTSNASDTDTTQYRCYHCEKRVSIETLTNLPDVICLECKNGFVESIPATFIPPFLPPSLTLDHVDDNSLGSQFLEVPRLIAQAAPQQRTQDPQSEDDFLRIELDGWENDEEDDGDANETEENRNEDEEEDEENEGGEYRSDNQNEENIENENEEDIENEDEEYLGLGGRLRRVPRFRIREFATQARTGRNLILDWADSLMGLEGNTIEFRLEVLESDRYIGNTDDYGDGAGYEVLLQNLAESEGGRRGAPPAAKSAVLELPTVEILTEQETIVCAICKDMVNIGETETKLPCGHGYHRDCIVEWLRSRNTCPLCRSELPTDDYEYEKERKKRVPASVGGALGSAGENSRLG